MRRVTLLKLLILMAANQLANSATDTNSSNMIEINNNKPENNKHSDSQQANLEESATISVIGSYLGSSNADKQSSRQELQQPSTKPARHRYTDRGPSNHQEYPADPYPSASYTSSVGSSSSNEPSLSALLHRDYHQSSGKQLQSDPSVDFVASASNNNSTFVNSYGNQLGQHLNSRNLHFQRDEQSQLQFNHNHNNNNINNNHHNHHQHPPGALETIIRNLTASLFPVKQLSNATLHTLGELLSKNRQSTSSGFNYHQPASSSYSIAPFGSSAGQFGFRDQSAAASSAFFRTGPKGNSNSSPFGQLDSPINQQQQSFKTSSNIYNTYMPYKDSALSAMHSLAADQSNQIPSNYLDASYKLPFRANSNMFASQAASLLTNPGFHYIQQHQLANQNPHLDKIVYHSTPFRPSIASPPLMQQLPNYTAPINQQQQVQSSTPLSTSTSTNAPPMSTTTTTASPPESQQRPKTEADQRSVSFASLGSSSSAVSDTKPEYTTNGQAINGARGKQRQETASTTELPDSSLTESDFESEKSQKAASGSSSLLLDLYEREIDNQIRDALLSGQQGSDSLVGIVRGSQSPWTAASSVYEDVPVEQTLGGWDRPIALGSQSSPMELASAVRSAGGLGVNMLESGDSLASALHELPTFSAADLQPILPAVPAYSLISPSSSSLRLATLTPNIFSMHQNLPLTPESSEHSKQQQSTSDAKSPPQSSHLPSILSKLQSSLMSSILGHPLSSLYANLPRVRGQKKPTTASKPAQSQKQPAQHFSSSSTQYSHYITPGSLLPHYSLGGISGKQVIGPLKGDSKQALVDRKAPKSQRQLAQQAALAAATANLLAAASTADHSLSPLQAAALMQAQASSAVYPTELSQLGKPVMGAFGLLSNGISPLVWRSIFSPPLGVRKHSTSSSSQTQAQPGKANNILSSLLGDSTQGSQQQQQQKWWSTSQPFEAHNSTAELASSKKPKLRIKILKIPVAFYYQQPTTTDGLPVKQLLSSSNLSLPLQPFNSLLLNPHPATIERSQTTNELSASALLDSLINGGADAISSPANNQLASLHSKLLRLLQLDQQAS